MNLKLPNIEAERARRNMNKQEFATFVGVSRRTVQNWQNGKTKIPTEKLQFLARSWEVSIDYLLENNG